MAGTEEELDSFFNSLATKQTPIHQIALSDQRWEFHATYLRNIITQRKQNSVLIVNSSKSNLFAIRLFADLTYFQRIISHQIVSWTIVIILTAECHS